MDEETAFEPTERVPDMNGTGYDKSEEVFRIPSFTPNAVRVLERRYLKRDTKGRVVETPREMFIRVARTVASAERIYGAADDEVQRISEKFYDMMASLDFMPNSPTLMNAGRELGQLSACFVLPVGDSIEEIFDSIKHTALIHKSGGGCASGDSRVITTHCGIERFETLYERLRAQGIEERDYDARGKWMDTSGLGIMCYSFDSDRQRFLLKKVEKVWRYDVSEQDCVTVRTSRGLSVQTSCWHPFLVRTEAGIEERRAEELRTGDQLIVPCGDISLLWPFEEVRTLNGVELDEVVSWTLGCLLGRSCHERDQRVDPHADACMAVEDLYERVLNGEQVDSRGFDDLEPTDRLFLLVSLYERLFGTGRLDSLPEMLSKSPRPVLLSFLAGILDGGCPSPDRALSIRFSDEGLLKDLCALLCIFGLRPTVKSEGAHLLLELDRDSTARLDSLVLPYLRVRCPASKCGGTTESADLPYDTVSVSETIRGKSVGRFFDLTVEGTNNYLAGEFGLTVIHNTGFSFSRLRPANDSVQTTKGVSSGPISFMEVFNAATETIKQGGTRRGANMGILRIDHPDIIDFITAKRDQKRLTNFNISVALTDKFIRAVKERQKYDLVNPRSGKIDRQLDAVEVFDLIVNMAWRNGEPGIVFIDRINRDNPTPQLGEIESTNPCGEQPLLPFESCNLGSLNLSHMLRMGREGWEMDWEKLRETTVWGVRFLDDVIDVNRYPLPQIEEMTKGNRKIGLGIMGFADMLLRRGVPYDSDEALDIARELMKFIHTVGLKASQELAERRGSFPNFDRSVFRGKYPCMRNATVTTIAPTGTISIIAGCSSGIEPLFAVAYTRNVMDRDELFEVNPVFEESAKERGFYSEQLMKRIAEEGSVAGMREIPEDIRRVFVTAHDISPEWHVRMQAAFQESTDNAVSKTVNFPRDATPEDVRKVYLTGYELGVKGVTVYRDGSRDEQVLKVGGAGSTGGKPPSGVVSDSPESGPASKSPRPRPAMTRGATQKMETGCGKLYVTINEDEHGLCEVFTQMGKSGGCTASQSEAIGRLISLALRSGIEVKSVIKQLRGIRCPSPLWQPGGMILSCSDAIAKALERYVEARETGLRAEPRAAVEKQNHVDRGEVCPECPECGAMVDYVEGCVVCRSCGYSRCW